MEINFWGKAEGGGRSTVLGYKNSVSGRLIQNEIGHKNRGSPGGTWLFCL